MLLLTCLQTSSSEESPADDASKISSPYSESTIYAPDSPEDPEEQAEAEDGLPQMAPIKPNGGGPLRKGSSMSLRRASTTSFRGPHGKMTDEEENKGQLKSRQSKEFSEQGKVKWDVYKEYAKQSNLVAVAIYLFTLVGAKTAEIGKLSAKLLLAQCGACRAYADILGR